MSGESFLGWTPARAAKGTCGVSFVLVRHCKRGEVESNRCTFVGCGCACGVDPAL